MKIGDRVRIKDGVSIHQGKLGMIHSAGTWSHWRVIMLDDNGKPQHMDYRMDYRNEAGYNEEELILVASRCPCNIKDCVTKGHK